MKTRKIPQWTAARSANAHSAIAQSEQTEAFAICAQAGHIKDKMRTYRVYCIPCGHPQPVVTKAVGRHSGLFCAVCGSLIANMRSQPLHEPTRASNDAVAKAFAEAHRVAAEAEDGFIGKGVH